MMQTKIKLRKHLIQQLKTLNFETKMSWDEAICQKFIQSEYCQNYQNFAIYSALPYEVSSQKIIDILLLQQKHVFLPRIRGQQIDFYQIKNRNQLVLNQWKIYEPNHDCPKINPQIIEVMVIPIVGFNQAFYRIGHGKGFYDQFFHKNALLACHKVGLAYQIQDVTTEQFIPDVWDVPLTDIITN